METQNPFDGEVPHFSEVISSSEKIVYSPHRAFYKIHVNDLLCAIDACEVIYNPHNRYVDKSRKFEKFDIESTEPIILGRAHDDQLHILDGQHRIEYLRSNAIKYATSMILLDVRDCPNEDEIMRQLQIINDRRIMKIEVDSRKVKYSQFLEIFKQSKQFTVIFKKNRPYINPDTLSSVIVHSDFFQSAENRPSDIFHKIALINQFISKLDRSKWSVDAKVDEHYVEKARETRYYLTFDREYHPIKELIDVEPSTFEAKWNDFLAKKRKRRFVVK